MLCSSNIDFPTLTCIHPNVVLANFEEQRELLISDSLSRWFVHLRLAVRRRGRGS